MNRSSFSSDDPQLTAFALGELEGSERAAVEAALQADPALRGEVERVRAAATMLETALKAELIGPPVAESATRALADGIAEGAVREQEEERHGSVGRGVPAEPRLTGDGSPRLHRSGEVNLPGRRRARSLRAEMFRFPRFYYVAGGLAAACLAVAVLVQRDELNTRHEAEATLARIARARSKAMAAAQGTTRVVAVDLSQPGAGAPAWVGAGLTAGRSVSARHRTAPASVSAGVRGKPFARVADQPRSMLPVETDPTGYAQIRRTIRQGLRPPAATVRIEDMLNFFPFRYPQPKGDACFAAALEVAAAPWHPGHRLVRVGLKGREAEETAGAAAGGSPAVLAKDVRIQIEFNPAQVSRYRLIGYDARPASGGEETEDPGDADDVSAGHVVTALYEIVPAGEAAAPEEATGPGGQSRYQPAAGTLQRWRVARVEAGRAAANRELLTVTVWYRRPDESGGRWLEFPLEDTGATFDAASPDFRFAAAVAQYGMILRGPLYPSSGTFGDVLAWAAAALPDPADDPGGLRFDFLDLVRRTQGLTE